MEGYSINWDEKKVTIETKALCDKMIKRMMKNDNIHYFKASNLNNLCPIPKKREQYRIKLLINENNTNKEESK